jgi:hypothetical protein
MSLNNQIKILRSKLQQRPAHRTKYFGDETHNNQPKGSNTLHGQNNNETELDIISHQ